MILYATILFHPISALAEVITLTPVKDTYVTQNNGGSSYGSSTLLQTKFKEGSKREALLQFDLFGIPQGAQITTAYLKLYSDYNRKFRKDTATRVYATLGSWSESTIWNTKPPRASSYEDSIAVTSTRQYFQWNITNLVQDWVDGVETNYGVTIRSEGGGELYFSSRDASSNKPILYIEYSISTPSPTLYVTSYGAKGDGTTDDTAAFIQALASAANNTLTIRSGTYRITSNITVNSNVTLVFQNGAKLLPEWVTITINGPIIAGLYQIFTGSGDIRLNSFAANMVVPQWFGAVGDGVAIDTVALRKWAASIQTGGGDLFLPTGTYIYDSYVLIPSNTRLTCADADSAVFKNKGTAQGLFNFVSPTSSNITIENCGFDANGYNVLDFQYFLLGGQGTHNNIQIRNNHMFDSNFPGEGVVKQRQYILVIGCFQCWVEDNHLEQGGRIKMGRPGSYMYIRRNTLDFINDNGITFVAQFNQLTENVEVTDNIILNPIGSGIFFGGDGQSETNPALTLRNILIARNYIEGNFVNAGIQGTLPNVAENIQILNNTVVKTGNAGAFSNGIAIARTDGATLPTQSVV
ncbi:MAG: repeat-associated core domain protein, partial [Candidatus Dadabacteria bacterium]|nr:repeat-associated core domain protein [Candidatus Dadabacteria bacterium]